MSESNLSLPINRLPNELLQYIFSYTLITDFGPIALVCKVWNDQINNTPPLSDFKKHYLRGRTSIELYPFYTTGKQPIAATRPIDGLKVLGLFVYESGISNPKSQLTVKEMVAEEHNPEIHHLSGKFLEQLTLNPSPLEDADFAIIDIIYRPAKNPEEKNSLILIGGSYYNDAMIAWFYEENSQNQWNYVHRIHSAPFEPTAIQWTKTDLIIPEINPAKISIYECHKNYDKKTTIDPLPGQIASCLCDDQIVQITKDNSLQFTNIETGEKSSHKISKEPTNLYWDKTHHLLFINLKGGGAEVWHEELLIGSLQTKSPIICSTLLNNQLVVSTLEDGLLIVDYDKMTSPTQTIAVKKPITALAPLEKKWPNTLLALTSDDQLLLIHIPTSKKLRAIALRDMKVKADLATGGKPQPAISLKGDTIIVQANNKGLYLVNFLPQEKLPPTPLQHAINSTYQYALSWLPKMF